VRVRAAPRTEDRRVAQVAGADYYFTKPFSPRTRLDNIYRVLFD
jgi:hypothetical protein